MSRGVKNILIFLGILLVAACVWYGGMAYFYANPKTFYNENGEVVTASETEKTFIYGTHINDQYCSGMTVSQVEEKLLNKTTPEALSITIDNQNYDIDLNRIGYTLSYKEPLEKALKGQNFLLWPMYALGKVSPIVVSPTYIVDEAGLNEVLDELNIKKNPINKESLTITLTEENGYVLNEDCLKDELRVDDARDYIKEQLLAGESQIVIDNNFYDEHVYTDDENRLIAYYEDIRKAQNREVSFRFGKEKKTISKYDWAVLINTSERPVQKITAKMLEKDIISYEIDEEKASKFIEEFLDEYNTYQNRFFVTNSGVTVYIPTGYYGNKIDVEKEKEWFVEFVNSNETVATRNPEYLIEKAKYKSKDDIGDTYIEVSIDDQHMWYYKDGKVFLETDVTTGAPYHGGTPTMSVMVQNRIRNKTLVGPNYRSFVKYWMGVNGAYGIHDASWRSVYGGEEYIHNGSHGCINTPEENVAKIFENIEVGTPVIIYSLEKNSLDNLEELRKPEYKKVLK